MSTLPRTWRRSSGSRQSNGDNENGNALGMRSGLHRNGSGWLHSTTARLQGACNSAVSSHGVAHSAPQTDLNKISLQRLIRKRHQLSNQ